MNYKRLVKVGIFCIVFSIIVITTSIMFELYLLLFAGIVLLVVSVIFSIFIGAIEIFSKDKIINIEELEQQGLTIVECKNCFKLNVKEDIYCIHCGEKLD